METPIAAFGQEMRAIIGALQGLPDTVSRVEGRLGGEIGGATRELTDTMTALAGTFRSQQEIDDGCGHRIQFSGRRHPEHRGHGLTEFRRRCRQGGRGLAGRISEIGAKASEASAEHLSGEVAKIAASLAASAEAVRTASDVASTNIRQAGAALDEGVRNSVETVHEASHKSSEELTGNVSSLSGVVKELCDRLSQSAVILEAQQGRLNRSGEIVATASTSLSNAAGSVERAAAPLPSPWARSRARRSKWPPRRAG